MDDTKVTNVAEMNCKLLVCLLCLVAQWKSVYTQDLNGVRLVDGTNHLNGRVEVFYDGRWGSVCDFQNHNALEMATTTGFICEQLGFPSQGATSFLTNSSNPNTTSFEIRCIAGSEMTLGDCNIKENLCVGYAGVQCSEEVSLLLRNEPYINNSLIFIEDIEEEMDSNSTLVCRTLQESCCLSSNSGGWFYPDGTEVSDTNETEPSSFYTTRGSDGTIRLNRPDGVTSPQGMFHCEVPDNENITQSLYIGIYSSTGGNITITNNLVYNMMTQTLVCTSSGGPATTVTWTKDNVTLNTDDGEYEETQVIIDSENATYENRLRITAVTDDTAGEYVCQVANEISDSTRSIQVTLIPEGTLRLANQVQDTIVEIFLEQEWQTLCSNPFIESQTQDPPLRNIDIQASATTITASWDVSNNDNADIFSYEITCSTTVGENQLEYKIVLLNPETTTVTLNGLLPLTTYSCCLTAYQDAGFFNLTSTATMCTTVATSNEPDITSSEPSNPTPQSCPVTYDTVAIGLGAIIGVMFVVVVIVVVCIPIAYLFAKRRLKVNIMKATAYQTQEVHLRNPIYTEKQPGTNEELEYSTIADAIPRHTPRRDMSNNTDRYSFPPPSEQTNKQLEQFSEPKRQLYEDVDHVKPQTGLVTSLEHPKPSYAVIKGPTEVSQSNKPRSIASVKPYVVVELTSSTKVDENQPTTLDTVEPESDAAEYSTIRKDNPTHGPTDVKKSPEKLTATEYSVPLVSPHLKHRKAATIDARNPTEKPSSAAEYTLPLDSPKMKELKKKSATVDLTKRVKPSSAVNNSSPRLSMKPQPQATPYQVVELACASQDSLLSLDDSLDGDNCGLIKRGRRHHLTDDEVGRKDSLEHKPSPYEQVTPRQSITESQ